MTTNSNNYKYRVGELRPSQILFTYGIGAVTDLPNLAVMVMGLEEWDRTRTLELSEDRLLAAVQAELGKQVKQLLTPPNAVDHDNFNPLDEAARIGIPVAPFPSWMICPKCRLLAPLQSNLFELKQNPYRINDTRYVHKNCPKTGKFPPTVLPVRFLVACENGHLDDFPWSYFVHNGNNDCQGSLRLLEFGVSGATTDIMVKCDLCDCKRRLSEAFGESGKRNLPRCRGRHPHLRTFDDDCNKQMKSMLLGASNSWFSITLSALSIPVAIGKLASLVEQHWLELSEAETEQNLQLILKLCQKKGELQDLAGFNLIDIWEAVEQKRQGDEQANPKDLKTPEWQVFSEANSHLNNKEFSLRPVASPTGYEKYFTQTVLIEKLREVRALIGFTRIQSPGDFADVGEIPSEFRVNISRKSPQWIPSAEVKGEGIFLQFNESNLQEWENLPEIIHREKLTKNAHKDWLNSRGLDPDKIKFPGMRYLLIHSFAHALMRQLVLECGYTAASIRERIYSQPPEEENGPQAGLLIYTSAADSEGTLGGLVSLGEPDILGYQIAQTLEQIKLCTSDPLCSEHTPSQGTPSLHWAACHACLFSPETSCERGNKFLDRGLLIPTLTTDNLAFFTDIT
jgi:hypothetical protein